MRSKNQTIRLATEKDGLRLAEMRWAFHSEHEEPVSQTRGEFDQRFREFFADALSSGRWFIWIAEENGEIVSHVYVFVVSKVPRPNETSETWGYITNVFTVPCSRSTGVGSALMDAVANWAMSQKLELLLVWPSEESVMFYERAGVREHS